MSAFTVKTPQMSEGYFKLRCWIGSNSQYEIKNLQLRVYDDSNFRLRRLSPQSITRNESIDVTITGEGFIDTGNYRQLLPMSSIVIMIWCKKICQSFHFYFYFFFFDVTVSWKVANVFSVRYSENRSHYKRYHAATYVKLS